MTTIVEQIVSRLGVVLSGATDVGANVYRSREIPVTRSVSPAIVIRPDTESIDPLSINADVHRLRILIEIFTRGDPADLLAAPIVAQAHALITQDQTLRTIASDVRARSLDWNSEEADRTAGVLTCTYEFTYLASARDISSPPA